MLRPLQDGCRPVMRKEEEVIDIFPRLAILPCLVAAVVKLGNRLQLLSVEIKSGIADASEKGRYASKRARCMAFLNFDHQVWVSRFNVFSPPSSTASS